MLTDGIPGGSDVISPTHDLFNVLVLKEKLFWKYESEAN